MTAAARIVLQTVLTLPAAADLPRDGWQHVLTGMGDDGIARFHYDHASGPYIVAERVGAGAWTLDIRNY